jgi:putative addiction module component (TIGR02574 family)
MLLTHDEIARLLPEERLALIGDLWDSLDPAQVPVTPSQQAELLRRFGSFDADRAGGKTWDELKAELARRAL